MAKANFYGNIEVYCHGELNLQQRFVGTHGRLAVLELFWYLIALYQDCAHVTFATTIVGHRAQGQTCRS